MANVFYPGSGTVVLVGKETTYGTAVTTDKRVGGHVQNVTINENNNTKDYGAVGKRATQVQVATMYDVDVSMSYAFQAGRLIAYGVGSDTLTNPSSANLHTLNCLSGGLDIDLPAFTLGVSNDASSDVVRVISGCKVDRVRLSADLNGPLMVDVDIVAQSISSSTSGTLTFVPGTATVQPPQFGSVTIGGTTITQLQSFEWTLNNNIQRVHAVGTRTINQAVPNRRTIDWNMTVLVDDAMFAKLLEYITGDTAAAYTPQTNTIDQAIVVTFTNGLTGASKNDIVISLTGFRADRMSDTSTPDGLKVVTLSGSVTAFDTAPILIDDDENAAYF